MQQHYTGKVICESCHGGGLNAATQKIKNEYIGDNHGKYGWRHQLTQDEVKLLFEMEKLTQFKEMPTAEMVNTLPPESHIFHDIDVRNTLVALRAEKQGVYGVCEKCKGIGMVVNERTWAEPFEIDSPHLVD